MSKVEIVIGGIFNSNVKQESYFKVIGNAQKLERIKLLLMKNLRKTGYSVKIEKGYVEE